MIRLFTVLLLVKSALAGPIGSVDYESSSGVSRASSAPAYSSGRLGTGKYSANYATAPSGPASSAAAKVTALYGSSQAAENGTSTYNSASAGPRAASAHGGHPIIGTFATPVNGYAPDQGLPDFFGGYPASPYGVVSLQRLFPAMPLPRLGRGLMVATPALQSLPPAYYGYGIPDLGYGVGSYEYGRGLIGYGLNYGYGLGTPLEYNALVRKKKLPRQLDSALSRSNQPPHFQAPLPLSWLP
ncbi:hypothetical protein MRX96_009186 [Rhipicephalus microplus]